MLCRLREMLFFKNGRTAIQRSVVLRAFLHFCHSDSRPLLFVFCLFFSLFCVCVCVNPLKLEIWCNRNGA